MYRVTLNPFYKEVVTSIKNAKNRLDKAFFSYNQLISGDEQKDSELSIKCIPHLAKIHDEISELKRLLREAQNEKRTA